MSIQSILNQLPQYAYDIDKSIREIFFQDLQTLEKYQKEIFHYKIKIEYLKICMVEMIGL